MRLALEKAMGIAIGIMAFEFAGRAVLHLSITTTLFGGMIR